MRSEARHNEDLKAFKQELMMTVFHQSSKVEIKR